MTAGSPTIRKDEIRARLTALARTPAPQKLAPGACCYAPADEPSRMDYVCPVCGERTVYGSSPANRNRRAQWFLEAELQACRRLVGQLGNLAATLDERAFCRHCRPDVDNPELILTIRYLDHDEHRVRHVTADDLQLLVEFTQGKTKHVGSQDSESPLKDHLPRLRKLLGLDE